MNQRKQSLSLVGTPDSERALESKESQLTAREFSRYPDLREAGAALGLSGPALRKKFDRGDLPRKFLLRVGPRTLRVDIAALVQYLKAQANPLSA